jgi:lipoate-protein ligase B
MNKICRVLRLGMRSYQQIWDFQNSLAAEIAAGQSVDTLMLLEHPHTFTLGRRGRAGNLLWSEKTLAEKGVDVFWVDRGGDITYHGPGQIVGYPILRLAPIGHHAEHLPQADYVGYIRKLETVLIQTLAHFQIEGFRVDQKTGVWVKPRFEEEPQKIASIGVKVDVHGVSRHGFALNVQPEMDYWQGIVPCGLAETTMTSMKDVLNDSIEIKLVYDRIIRDFGQVFDLTMVEG